MFSLGIMNSSEDWDVDLAPEEFDQSIVSQSTQDEDYESPDSSKAAKSCRLGEPSK